MRPPTQAEPPSFRSLTQFVLDIDMPAIFTPYPSTWVQTDCFITCSGIWRYPFDFQTCISAKIFLYIAWEQRNSNVISWHRNVFLLFLLSPLFSWLKYNRIGSVTVERKAHSPRCLHHWRMAGWRGQGHLGVVLLQMQPQLYLCLSETAFKTWSRGKFIVEKTPLESNFLFIWHFESHLHLPRKFLDISQNHAWPLMWPEFGEPSDTLLWVCLFCFQKN